MSKKQLSKHGRKVLPLLPSSYTDTQKPHPSKKVYKKPIHKPTTSATVPASIVNFDSDSEDNYEMMDPRLECSEMSLNEFCTQFGESLPQQIMISKGTYGMDDVSSLSTSDLYNIHSIRRRKMVRVSEKRWQQVYAIPVDSSIKFAPVFNEYDSMDQITKGECFPYVSDILDLVIMPKVVCACHSYNGGAFDTAESDGEMRDILAIREVVHPDVPGKPRKLRVFSITDLEEKFLDDCVYGQFSTKPQDIRIFMSDILKYVSNPFPMHLVMFKETDLLDNTLGLPRHLFSNILKMEKKFTEVIFIATPTTNSSSSMKSEPFELPADVDVDVQLVKLPESYRQKLIKETEQLNEATSMNIRIFKYENTSDEVYRAQSKFYNLVRCKNREKDTVTVDHLKVRSKRSLISRIESLEKQTPTKEDLQQSFKEFITTKLEELNTTVAKQTLELVEARQEIAYLRRQVEGLESIVYKDGSPAGCRRIAIDVEGNKKKLANFDQSQLIGLLVRHELSQYSQRFIMENMNGALLLECDEDLLEKDLGVCNRSDRIKFLKLISGKLDLT